MRDGPLNCQTDVGGYAVRRERERRAGRAVRPPPRPGVHGRFEASPPDQLTWAPAPGANTIGWLVWHLARVQDSHIAELLGEEEIWATGDWASRFGLPSGSADTGYGYTARQVAALCGRRACDALVDYFTDVHERTIAYLGGLSDADLDRGRRRELGPAGDARRAAGQRGRRRRAARRPGGLRARAAPVTSALQDRHHALAAGGADGDQPAAADPSRRAAWPASPRSGRRSRRTGARPPATSR